MRMTITIETQDAAGTPDTEVRVIPEPLAEELVERATELKVEVMDLLIIAAKQAYMKGSS